VHSLIEGILQDSKYILKGKPQCPNKQGSSERGNADFKKALLKWEQEYPNEKWSMNGNSGGEHELEPTTFEQ
jgi:hypothetical protein